MSHEDTTEIARFLASIKDIIAGDPDQADRLLDQFEDMVPHPCATDLLFHPEDWGLGQDATLNEVAELALSWTPRILAMDVVGWRGHPALNTLICYEVVASGQILSQVIDVRQYHLGDVVAVALSGVEMPCGRVVRHGFIQGAFTIGKIVGRYAGDAGTELHLSDCEHIDYEFHPWHL